MRDHPKRSEVGFSFDASKDAPDLARRLVAARHAAAKSAPRVFTVPEMQIRELRNNMRDLHAHRHIQGLPIGSLAGWLTVLAHLTAAISTRRVNAKSLDNQCAAVGLSGLDPSLVAEIAEKVGAAHTPGTHGLGLPSPTAIGHFLGLTRQERDNLGIRRIDAIDETAEQRKKRRKREWQQAAREAKGARSRVRPAASSERKPPPWVLAGVSKSTFYRRGFRISRDCTNEDFTTYKGEIHVQSQNPGEIHEKSHRKGGAETASKRPIGEIHVQSQKPGAIHTSVSLQVPPEEDI